MSISKNFNLITGNTLMKDLASHVKNFVRDIYQGYSSEIQSSAAKKAADFSGNRSIELLRAGVLSLDDAKIKLSTNIIFDSSNWTGRNFDGFKKPVIVIDGDVSKKDDNRGFLPVLAPSLSM